MAYRYRYQQRGRIRRLLPAIGIIASAFPLLADETSYEQHESDNSECMKSPASCVVISQNEQNLIDECHSNSFIYQNIVKYRLFGEGDAQRFEEVLLHKATVRNGSTIIPFYPFDFDEYDGASPQLKSDFLGSHIDAESIDDSSITSNMTSIEADSNIDSLDKDNVSAPAASNDASNTRDGSDNTELVAVDYASKSAGALVLDSSPNFQGASNLLQKDRDKYAIVPCDEAVKYVIIGLSEDILVKQFAISNYERYSSHMKDVRLYGSTSTTAIRNTNKWIDLGTFTTNTNKSHDTQNFFLVEPTWARYLKVEFLSHHGDEFYCTVSQISVHGSTVLQGFHEQWNEDIHDDAGDSSSSVGAEAIPDDVLSENGIERDGPINLSPVENDSNSTSEPDLIVQMEGGRSRRRPLSVSGYCIQFSDSRCFHPSNFENKMAQFSSSNGSASVCYDMNPSDFFRTLSDRQKFSTVGSDSSFRLPRRQSLTGFGITYSKNHASLLIRSKSKPAETRSFGRAGMRSSYVFGMERLKEALRTTLGGMKDNDLVESWLVPTRIVSDKKTDPLPTDDKPISSSLPIEIDDDRSDRNNVGNVEEIGAMLAKVLTRLPSAKCLETLDFVEFKSSSKASGTKTRNGSSSAGSSNAAANMEPIFKKLSDEIKSLQSNVAIHDQFTKLSVSCYQRVMLELLIEIEADRRSYNERFSKLENDLQFGSSFVSLQHFITSVVLSALHWLYWICVMFVHQFEGTRVGSTSLGRFGLFVGFISFGIYTALKFRRRSSGKSTVSKEVNDELRRESGAVPQPSFPYKNGTVSEDEEDSLPMPQKQAIQSGMTNLMRISP
jgi:Sad1 / UNC-like C-terminal